MRCSLGAVAIVKDEAENAPRLVESARAAGASCFTIVDTGSTDGTQKRLEEVGITVHERPWVDFGTNRSEALALARGTADWLLAIDADMTVEMDPDFEPDPAVEAYMIRVDGVEKGLDYRLPLLLRGDLPWESRGAVHEYTCLPGRGYASADTDRVRVRCSGSRASRDKSLWYAGMLEAEVERDPSNARSVFYLANEYRGLGDPRAVGLYERRALMGGFDEEVYLSMHRYAMLLPSWPSRAEALAKAWEHRPCRLESAYELAKGHNERGQHRLAYQIASTPAEPIHDLLFVNRAVWDWGMDFERSIAAWWTGRRGECWTLSNSLLERDLPPSVRTAVERNRSLC